MADEPDPLWLIPRAVRDKLDRIAVKLHLRDWQALNAAQRQQICDQPCGSREEAEQLTALLRSLLGRELEPLNRMRET